MDGSAMFFRLEELSEQRHAVGEDISLQGGAQSSLWGRGGAESGQMRRGQTLMSLQCHAGSLSLSAMIQQWKRSEAC